MKIYLSASYSRRQEMCEYAEQIEKMDHDVISSWLWNAEEQPELAKQVENAKYSISVDAGHWFAQKDIADLEDADLFIFFSEPTKKNGRGRGGRHVELGYALAMGIPIYLIGPLENVFHCLPEVQQIDSWEEMRSLLNAERENSAI